MSKHKKPNSRRDFLKTAAIGVGGLSAASSGLAFTGSFKENQNDPPNITSLTCDVAVVGGGVSGTYAALRLASQQLNATNPGTGINSIGKPQNPRSNSVIEEYLSAKVAKQKKNGQMTINDKLDVLLFEYSGRIGGRLLSTPIPRIPVGNDELSGPLQYAEFGGFRFDHQMKIVWETAQALNLKDETFYYQEIEVEKNNIVKVRGDIYTNSNPDPVQGFKQGEMITSHSYLSYPNIKPLELKILEAGNDLGNYVTDKAFEGVLPNAVPGQINKTLYPNIVSIAYQNQSIPPQDQNYSNNIIITFKKALNPNYPPTVIIPSGDANGWSFSLVRYHYAFNAGDWTTVKSVSDQYENAKKVARIGGRPFYNWSWWGLKRFYLSQEAVAYLEDSSGYNEEGTAGTIETVIDENYYFSVKSTSDSLIALTQYTDNANGRSVSTAWRHITEGYSAIPNNLYKKYKSINNNSVKHVIKNQLVAFTRPDPAGEYKDFKYRCLFYLRQPGPANSITGSQGLYNYMEAANTVQDANAKADEKAAAEKVLENYKIVYCNFLILAMPRRALEMIDQNNFFFGATGVQSVLMNSVHNIPSMRMFVAYPRAWWIGQPPYTSGNPNSSESNYFPVGRTRTDLGLRQLYYWCYNKKSGAAPGQYADPLKPAVMLASYTSGVATLYWRSFQNGQPYDLLTGSQLTQAHYLNEAAGKPPPPPGESKNDNRYIRNPQAGGPRHGSMAMGLEAHRQIVELHGRSADYANIPLPYYVHFEDWTKDPWGAGWHGWQSSFPKINYIPLIRNPLPDENIFIIGECYSNVQGWVQGALNSAESMLQCNLGLKWAPWLSIEGIWLGQGTKWVVPSASAPDPDPCLPIEPFPRVINTQNY